MDLYGIYVHFTFFPSNRRKEPVDAEAAFRHHVLLFPKARNPRGNYRDCVGIDISGKWGADNSIIGRPRVFNCDGRIASDISGFHPLDPQLLLAGQHMCPHALQHPTRIWDLQAAPTARILFRDLHRYSRSPSPVCAFGTLLRESDRARVRLYAYFATDPSVEAPECNLGAPRVSYSEEDRYGSVLRTIFGLRESYKIFTAVEYFIVAAFPSTRFLLGARP